MSTLQQWRDERATLLSKATQVVDGAKAARRDLTPTEQQQVTDLLAQVDRIDRQTKGKELADRVMGLGSAEDDHRAEYGDGLFGPEAKAGLIHAVKTRTMFRTEVDRKALTSGTLLPTSGTGVEAGLQPNAVFALADLFRNEPAGGPTVRYYRTTAGTAAVVAEGAEKPDSGTAITAHDVALKKIAALTKVSDELSEDAPFLLDALAMDLRSAVLAKENAEIITTINGTSGILTGTGDADDVIDLVGTAISGQEVISGNTPVAVIANPVQVAAIRALKDTSGTYHVDPWTAGPPSLHGLRLVSSPAVTAGIVWVVSSQAAVIYRRGPVSVEVGLDGADFSHNLRTVISEERMAPAVVRPSGITRITLT